VKNDPVVAIAGVTGAVGAQFIATLEKRRFPVRTLKPLASARSAGKTLEFRGQRIVVEELNERSFDGVDIVLFSAGSSVSMRFSPIGATA
jgi:aspartate-semialdehyde dehydrogenase